LNAAIAEMREQQRNAPNLLSEPHSIEGNPSKVSKKRNIEEMDTKERIEEKKRVEKKIKILQKRQKLLDAAASDEDNIEEEG